MGFLLTSRQKSEKSTYAGGKKKLSTRKVRLFPEHNHKFCVGCVRVCECSFVNGGFGFVRVVVRGHPTIGI